MMQRLRRRLLLPAIVLSRFAAQPPGIITGILLIDIGMSFGVPVSIISQIRTSASILSMIFALLLGALCTRIKHKTLLLTGLALYIFSALGCFLAPSYTVMLLSYAIVGIGSALVHPMAATLIGEHFSREERPSAFGWSVAGTSIAFLLGSPVVSYIVGIGGWRLTFLGFMLPVVLISFIVVYFAVPPKPLSAQDTNPLGGFIEIVANRSAISCLLSESLGMASWMGVLTYGVSFYRQRFLVPLGWATVLFSGFALGKTFGSLFSGRLVRKFGMKPMTFLSILIIGITTSLFTIVPNLYLSLALSFSASVFSGLRDSASSSLSLEQIPRFRGTMMSLRMAAGSVGYIIGTVLGGYTLLISGYELMGFSIGVLGILSAIITFFLIRDPLAREEHSVRVKG
ncbi:MFS transporter [Candidatus Bathyarchaeota archaeon]|nr:MFS transporter [Candidatus Bathyarchaeota archaeon]